ncbi:hypothetical protein D3C87_2111580 [compost metagenome]
MPSAAAKKATATGAKPSAVEPIAAARMAIGIKALREVPSRISRSASGRQPISCKIVGSCLR